MKLDFDSLYYKEFLKELHSITCIDLIILDNLIKLQFIQNILVNPDAISISSDSFLLDKESICLKNNYTQLPEFIFASYPLYNPDFQILLSDEQLNTCKYKLVNYNLDLPIVLDFVADQYSNDLYIKFLFNINLKDFYDCDIDIDLLSEKENFIFQYYINSKLRFLEDDCSIQILFLNSKKHYFMLNEYRIENFQHFTIDTLLKQKETEFKKLSESLKTIYKNDIFKLLEPALLRKQMNNF